MDWDAHLLQRPLHRDQRQRHRLRADRHRASTSTSATPACSTSARPPSPRSAPTASPSRSARYGWSFWAAIPSAHRRRHRPRPAPRHPDAAPARRLPRHRHDRRRRDHPPRRSARCASAGCSAATTACRASPATCGRLNPFGAGRFTAVGAVVQRATTCSSSSSAGSLVALASLPRLLLMRSPWGRVLKSIREDEDAVRSLGKNVFTYKMQSLILGGVIGAFGGMVLAVGNRVAQPDNYSTDADVLRLHDPHPRRRGEGVGPDRRRDDLLVRHRVRRQRAGRGVTRRLAPMPGWIDLERQQLRSGQVHPRRHRRWSLLVVFRPQGIFGDKREQVFDVR